MNILLVIPVMAATIIAIVLFGLLIYWVQQTKNLRYLSVGVIAVFLSVGTWWLMSGEKDKDSKDSKAVSCYPLYPNYDFQGVNQIKVPLIPANQRLPREAGGWVITPAGSEFRSDYEVPIIIEYIDGRKFHREPRKPAWDQVRPANSIFRLYGKEGEYATVTIKRGVY